MCSCGKSSLLYKISGPAFREVTLDDLQLRKLAAADPALFLFQNSPPVLIDEAQYAPELFSQIKIEIDRRRRENRSLPVLFRLTGSNQVHFDRRIKESLAGRLRLSRELRVRSFEDPPCATARLHGFVIPSLHHPN